MADPHVTKTTFQHSTLCQFVIGDGSAAELANSDSKTSLTNLLERNLSQVQIALITDENVNRLYGDELFHQLGGIANVHRFVLPAGEKTKSVEQLNTLWNDFIANAFNRDSLVIAFGGGVIGDLAGFAAASFARGIELVQIPTTLMAQVDSSIGGKTGINLNQAKNMVGAFWQPKCVVIDPTFLNTLGDEDFRSGLAEVVKYGVISDASFFSWLVENSAAINQRDPSAIEYVVRTCSECKIEIVESDPLEQTGLRAKLNYGHTFAHAIETVFGYGSFTHGQAVSIGMACAAQLARLMHRVGDEFCQTQQSLLEQLNLPTACPTTNHHQMLSVMQVDKKNRDGQLRFILPTAIGNVELAGGIHADKVLETLKLCSS